MTAVVKDHDFDRLLNLSLAQFLGFGLTLRHTFGSWAAIAGVPMRTIQKLMGHRSITTTERYAHLSRENLEEAVQRLGTLVTNPATGLPKPDKKALPAAGPTPEESWCPWWESNPHVP